jgi:hypothetical protein
MAQTYIQHICKIGLQKWNEAYRPHNIGVACNKDGELMALVLNLAPTEIPAGTGDCSFYL